MSLTVMVWWFAGFLCGLGAGIAATKWAFRRVYDVEEE